MKTMPQKTFVEKIITWVGSVASLIIHTTLFLVAFLLSISDIVSWSEMLLFLTTIVSLEAIYLAIFIQMTVNRQTKEIIEVSQDVDEIQEDIEEISQDVDEIQKDVEDINEEEKKGEKEEKEQKDTLARIYSDLKMLIEDIDELKKKN